MPIKKILWPTDFSHGCDLVLPYVCSLAQKYGAGLELLYVADDLSDYREWYGELTDEHAQRLRDWEVEHAKEKLEQVCETGLAACPILEKKVVLGDPALEILKVAEQGGADMIIMASRGRGAEKHGTETFGSVAEKVVKGAKVPVTIVNPSAVEEIT